MYDVAARQAGPKKKPRVMTQEELDEWRLRQLMKKWTGEDGS